MMAGHCTRESRLEGTRCNDRLELKAMSDKFTLRRSRMSIKVQRGRQEQEKRKEKEKRLSYGKEHV